MDDRAHRQRLHPRREPHATRPVLGRRDGVPRANRLAGGGPGYFTRYSHPRRQRNRMHIDITPFDDRRATRVELEVERDRLIALGASLEKELTEPWGPFEEYAIMMRDSEGNEFCLQ